MSAVDELIATLNAKLPLDVILKCSDGDVRANSMMIEMRCEILHASVKKSANKTVDVAATASTMKHIVKFIHVAKYPDWDGFTNMRCLHALWVCANGFKLTALADMAENAILNRIQFVSKAIDLFMLTPITEKMRTTAIKNIFDGGRVDRRYELSELPIEIREQLLEMLLRKRCIIE
jgi:hypothetical protein